MNQAGIYIFNSENQLWYTGPRLGPRPKEGYWGSFDRATEWPDGEQDQAEAVREIVSPDGEATYTMAWLQ